MGDRTTINIDKAEHRQTREVKAEYDDSWTDVLQFYREHREEVSVTATSESSEMNIDYAEIANRTADEVERRLR